MSVNEKDLELALDKLSGMTDDEFEKELQEAGFVKEPDPCHICGEVPEGDWGGVMEFGGYAAQCFGIVCDEHDFNSVYIDIHPDKPFTPSVVENIAVEAWDKLQQHLKEVC